MLDPKFMLVVHRGSSSHGMWLAVWRVHYRDARCGYLSWVFAIGRMDATCQLVPSWTKVWQIRNVLF